MEELQVLRAESSLGGRALAGLLAALDDALGVIATVAENQKTAFLSGQRPRLIVIEAH